MFVSILWGVSKSLIVAAGGAITDFLNRDKKGAASNDKHNISNLPEKTIHTEINKPNDNK